MMRSIFIGVMTLCFLFIFFTPENSADEKITEEGTFSRREVNDDEGNGEKVEVQKSAPNLRIEKLTEPKDISVIPKGTTASKIATSIYSITWSPLWIYEGLGGPRLSAATVSGDNSVIAIVEITGTSKGPFGSNIIFMETYGYSFIRSLRFRDEKISSILFIPDSSRIICRFDRQGGLKKPYKLAILDAQSGKIVSETKIPMCEISGMITDTIGSKLFVKPSKSSNILIFETEDISKEPVKVDSEIDDEKSSIAISSDNLTLTVCGNGKIRFFDMELKRFKKETVQLPDGAKSGHIIFTGAGEDFIVMIPGGNAYLFRDSVFRPVMDLPGKQAFRFSRDNKNLIMITGEKNSSVNIFTVPEFDLTAFAFCSKIKPYTLGEIICCGYLENKGCFFVLDSLGNFMQLRKSSAKKWKKDLIFKAAK